MNVGDRLKNNDRKSKLRVLEIIRFDGDYVIVRQVVFIGSSVAGEIHGKEYRIAKKNIHDGPWVRRSGYELEKK